MGRPGLVPDPRIYWTNSEAEIYFASLSGGGGGQLNTTGATTEGVTALAIEPNSRRIFWWNNSGGGDLISFANHSGGGGSDLPAVSGLATAYGMVLDPSPSGSIWPTTTSKAASGCSTPSRSAAASGKST